jgi:hypothetical protein
MGYHGGPASGWTRRAGPSIAESDPSRRSGRKLFSGLRRGPPSPAGPGRGRHWQALAAPAAASESVAAWPWHQALQRAAGAAGEGTTRTHNAETEPEEPPASEVDL